MNNTKTFFVAIMFLFALGGFVGNDLNTIGSIRANDPVHAGDQYFMHINLHGEDDDDLEDVQVRVLIYDLGIILGTSEFDLEDDERDGQFLFWDVPYWVPSGDYWVRITVSNDDFTDTKHRIITVI